MSQPAVLLVPDHNSCTVAYFSWKHHGDLETFNSIDNSCCGGIFTERFVSLLIKKYQRDEKYM